MKKPPEDIGRVVHCLPNLITTEEEIEIGVRGQHHLRYIKQHHKVRYTNLLTSGKLNGYLADIDKQAEDMLFRLVKQMTEREGPNSLKRIIKCSGLLG